MKKIIFHIKPFNTMEEDTSLEAHTTNLQTIPQTQNMKVLTAPPPKAQKYNQTLKQGPIIKHTLISSQPAWPLGKHLSTHFVQLPKEQRTLAFAGAGRLVSPVHWAGRPAL